MKKTSVLLVVIMLASMALSPATSSAVTSNVFNDISKANINFEAIAALKTKGVIHGYDNGNYQPDTAMNRAEFIKILMGSITPNPKGKNCFDDVHTEWFAPSICEAKTRGIVQGVNNTNFFQPGEKIKFSEAAKIIAKAYQLQKEANDPKIWYKKPIETLATQKAIPLSVEYFDENVDRGEIAEMIWRVQNHVTSKASRTYPEISGEGLITVDSCETLQQYYEENRYQNSYGIMEDNFGPPRALPLAPMMEEGAVGAPAPDMAAPAPAASKMAEPGQGAISSGASDQNAKDYSSTNIQVQGVDEADIVKNDGQYIYLVKGKSVRIVQANPPDTMKETSTINLGDEKDNFSPSELYIDGNTMVILGRMVRYLPLSDIAKPSVAMFPYPEQSKQRSKVFIVDITDRSKPAITRQIEFDGDYQTSRKVGGTLYLVLNQSAYYPFYYDPAKESYVRKTDEFLPKMTDSQIKKEELIAPCNQIRLFPKPPSFNFLITAAIAVNKPDQAVKRSVLVGDTQNVYASTSNLYVASTSWNDGFYKPESTSEGQRTKIYKFALGDGDIQFKTNTSVPGSILNQFSMDEDNGNFRIATTTNAYGEEGSATLNNNLYILDQDLKPLGKIEKIAPGEKLYAVRFLGKRAYLVTFKTIDPLFVLDVADPAHPKILGELKIPGYSNYLHPYDENHLIGFGKEVNEEIDADKVHSSDAVYFTAVQGMKLGLFDVSDVNNPKVMFTQVIGDHGTESELLNNHKALLFDKDKELLAFPITVVELPDKNKPSCKDDFWMCLDSAKTVFEGAYVYKINLQNGFQLKGKITHLNSDEQKEMGNFGYSSAYDKTIQRILYIGQNLFTVSQGAIKANDLTTLEEKKLLLLAPGKNDLPPPPMPIMY